MPRAMFAHVRRLRRDERGMSLPELLIAMSILSIVLLVFGSVLATVQGAVVRQDSLSQTLDQSRLALQQLDREMRSGNVLYDPALENGIGPGAIVVLLRLCRRLHPSRLHADQQQLQVRAVEDRREPEPDDEGVAAAQRLRRAPVAGRGHRCREPSPRGVRLDARLRCAQRRPYAQRDVRGEQRSDPSSRADREGGFVADRAEHVLRVSDERLPDHPFRIGDDDDAQAHARRRTRPGHGRLVDGGVRGAAAGRGRVRAGCSQQHPERVRPAPPSVGRRRRGRIELLLQLHGADGRGDARNPVRGRDVGGQVHLQATRSTFRSRSRCRSHRARRASPSTRRGTAR